MEQEGEEQCHVIRVVLPQKVILRACAMDKESGGAICRQREEAEYNLTQDPLFCYNRSLS
jgi:hypothetical protein